MTEMAPSSAAVQERDGYGDDDEFAKVPGGDLHRQLGAIWRHRVTLAALGLILGTVIWKGVFLSHYFFQQDDFAAIDLALKSKLDWAFLSHVAAGHFFPGVYLISWVIARTALYDWLTGSAIVLVMIALASFGAWRLLRTLLGNRPALLIPLALYLFSPLTFPTDSWWIAAVEELPLQIALFLALTAHVHYIRTGKLRHAAAAAAWMFLGMFFFEKAVLVPVLLFAVTVGFLSKPRLLPALRDTIRRFWRGWLLYLALAGAYVAAFLVAAHTSKVKTTYPSAHDLQVFSSKLIMDTLVPGILGGPWHWYHVKNAPSAFAQPPAGVRWAALGVLLILIGVSIAIRRRSWRAWAAVAGWVVLADMVPVAIGRLTNSEFAGLLGMDSRYVADAPAVLAIAMAFAFWPIAGAEPEGQTRSSTAGADPVAACRRSGVISKPWRVILIILVAAVLASSIWSVQRFKTLTTRQSVTTNRAYVANARAALAAAPPGTVIVSQLVPTTLMLGIFGSAAQASVVIGPLVTRHDHIRWTSEPVGTIGSLKVFGPDGRLWPAGIAGGATQQLPWPRGCIDSKRSDLVLRFPAGPVNYASELQIGYVAKSSAAGSPVTLSYGGFTGHFTVQLGLHNVYFPVHGGAPDVMLRAPAVSGGLCFGPALAGYVAVASGSPIPAEVAGGAGRE